MNSSNSSNPAPALHTTVYRLLRENIESGRLLPGTLLTVHGLANQFSLSREPVGRALQRLETEGIIVRGQTRGYLVRGGPKVPVGQATAATAATAAIPALDISPATLELFRGQTGWQKIWDRVQDDLIASMPFGRYKIVEMTMATYYGVSRTVTRDLLARLEALGLVEREGRSQCYLRQLTPELMSELYEVRCLLEPVALLQAAPLHQKETLEQMRAELLDAERRYPDVPDADVTSYEEHLHVALIETCPNQSLLDAVRQSQILALASNRLIPLYLGMPSSEPFFAEHRLVVELLLNGAAEAAAVALDAHLKSAVRKQHLRLSELKKHEPRIPPYLMAVAAP